VIPGVPGRAARAAAGAPPTAPQQLERDRRRSRELATWLTLGLVVAAVVVMTTRPGVTRVPPTAGGGHGPDAGTDVSRRARPQPYSVAERPPRSGSRTTDRPRAWSSHTSVITTPARRSSRIPPTTRPSRAPTSAPPTTSAPTTAAPAPPTTAPEATTAPPVTIAAFPTALPRATTTTAPRATTTTAPRATLPGPRIVSQEWPGNLQYPDDIEATFSLRTSGGVVSATAAWSGAPALAIAVRCAGGARSATGTTGLYVSAVALAGTCDITISEAAGDEAVVSYSLVTHYPAWR